MTKSAAFVLAAALMAAMTVFGGIATNIILTVGETTDVLTRTYSGKDRWWKLGKGDTNVTSAAFVEANPSEPRLSGAHSTEAKFTFTGRKAGGPTTWQLYSYDDQGQAEKGEYPGYDKTGGSGAWSDGCGHTFTITVTDPNASVDPTYTATILLEKGAQTNLTVTADDDQYWQSTCDSGSDVATLTLAYSGTSSSNKKDANTFTFKGLKTGTATFTVETRASSRSGSWTAAYTYKVIVTDSGPGGDDPVEPTEPDDPTPTGVNLFSVTPYVQHPATNAMTVLFFTTSSCAAKVKCWRADGTGETNVAWTACEDVSAALGKNPADKSDDTLTFSKQYKHRVRFENLCTHADYVYVVMPEGGKHYANVFRTLPDRNTPVRFIGLCDTETQSGTTSEWDTHSGSDGAEKRTSYFVTRSVGYASNIVHMVARQPDLITISGDLAAKGGYQKYWDEFWKENAGGLGLGYNDPAGSIPILAAIGNHDLKEGETLSSSGGGEDPLKKFLTYFEFNSNGVHYTVSDGTTTPEERDMSQLFHREDLGPVTLLFLDTNKGDNSDYTKETQHYSERPAMRSPDFHPGTLQYAWLTNNLADAQRNSRFTFVINHHCPYSVGIHNRMQGPDGYQNADYSTNKNPDGESARAVRALTETMIRYGVDAWLCGHDEIQEHSQTNGVEVLPDGTTRPHTLNVYDLGSGGDGLRGKVVVENPLEVFRAFKDEPDVWENGVLKSGGCHYGHLEVDVTTNRLGKWTCSLTPVYVFVYKDANKNVRGFERRCYKDRIIIDEESNRLVYQEWKGDTELPANHLEYERVPRGGGEVPVEPPVDPVDPPDDPTPEGKQVARAFSVTPYVQHPATNAMTVVFFTTNKCAATVRCWPADAADGVVTQTLAATCEKAADLVSTGHSSDKPVWGTQYKHRVRFEGLKPGTRHAYEVRLDGAAAGGVYANLFRTVPDRDTPVRFVAYSDSETVPPDFVDTTGNNKADNQGCTKQWEVLEDGEDVTKTYLVSRSEGYATNIVHMQAWKPDFIVIAGDLVARGGVQLFWDEFWKENAGANGVGYNDPAGSTPILATLGNHDFYDNEGSAALNYNISNKSGEFSLKKYLTYFEFNSNGVDYAHAPASEKDTRDLSQMFHRTDYGPVTIICIDSNNSKDSDGNDTNTGLSRNGSTGARSPDFNPGTLQHAWLTNSLADAQAKSRFTFVVCHHCPYSSGKHIKPGDSQCALPVRVLTDVFLQYGVDGLLCGHDEAQEHSQIHGTEIRPDGSTRPHTLNVYDLGSGGDGLKGAPDETNDKAVYRAYQDSPDGLHYGHLRVEAKKGASGIWQCSLTPAYSYWTSAGGKLVNELRLYKDAIIVTESGTTVFEQYRDPASEPPAEEPLPAIGDAAGADEQVANEEMAQVLEKTPLEGRVTTLGEYSDFKAWVDAGVTDGAIADQQAAKTNEMSFFSFATDQAGIVPSDAVTEATVAVKDLQVADGGVTLTVAIDEVPVGAGARQKYLEKVFGVTGAEAPDAAFAAENVTYRQDMRRNGDGSVSYTAAPKVGVGEPVPTTFFFKANVTK